ncbi:MAG: energy transducer TonB family protein [Brevinema sp.]
MKSQANSYKDKKIELHNIILDTVQEIIRKEEDALISDKNNISSSARPDLKKEEKYNVFNPNLQKAIVFEQILEEKQDIDLGDDFDKIEKIVPDQANISHQKDFSMKKKPPTTIANNIPSLYNPDEPTVINLYNIGSPSLATHSKEFADYLLNIKTRIEIYHREFFPVYQYFQGLIRSGTVVVEFTINKDGDVIDAKIVESYGLETVDNASFNSVVYAKNFGPLPEELAKNGSIKINFHFVYVGR